MELKDLQKIYRLSPQEHEQIYSQIKETVIGSRYPSKRLCNLIIGQSGSGKSNYSYELQKKDPSIIVMNGDHIRSFHPSITPIMEQYPRDICYIILDDWISWWNQLIRDLIQEGYYFNFETGLKQPVFFQNFIKDLQLNKYQFHIYVIALSYMESRVRILERFFSMCSSIGTGRLIESVHQQASFQNIANSINTFTYPELLSLTFLDYRFFPHPVLPGAAQNQMIFESIRNESMLFLKEHFRERLDNIRQLYNMYRDNLEKNLGERLDEQITELFEYFDYPLQKKKSKILTNL